MGKEKSQNMVSQIADEILKEQKAVCQKMFRALSAVTLLSVGLPPLLLLAGWVFSLGPLSLIIVFVSQDGFYNIYPQLPKWPHLLLVFAGVYLLIIAGVTVARGVVRHKKTQPDLLRPARPAHWAVVYIGLSVFVYLARDLPFAWASVGGALLMAALFFAAACSGWLLVAKLPLWIFGIVADSILCLCGGIRRLLPDDQVGSSCLMLSVLCRRLGFITALFGGLAIFSSIRTVATFFYQAIQMWMRSFYS
jgi:hypothetical protein